ncbi:carboxyl transferase domain-containing protein, partial [Kineococcus glutinatus]|uniref:carboxyl transferase domain-containing protein n=1 Tax=Kineococcus glutinatus TaxID=1070872 RepID=UPI0031ECFA4D
MTTRAAELLGRFLDGLLDDGPALRLGDGAADGPAVLAASGAVEGRDVVVCACAGELGAADVELCCRAVELAARTGHPLLTVHDGAAPRPADGLAVRGATGRLLRACARLSGVVPQVAVVLGEVTAEQAVLVALADVVVVADAVADGAVPGTRPRADLPAPGTAAAADLVRDVLSFLPANNLAAPPRLPPQPPATGPAGDLAGLVPAHPTAGYDVREVVAELADDGEVLELGAGLPGGVVTGFARLDGRSA